MAYTTIDDPTAHFKVQLYTGDGNDDRTVTFDDTDTDMQPDLIILKGRNFTDDHTVFDVVRGVNKWMATNRNYTSSDTADPNFGVKSFDSDGFTLGPWSALNGNTNTHVAWCWKAGAGAGSSNTDGSINTTTTSVSTTAGFSISSYTGTGANATVGHGLGAAPEWLIVKRFSASGEWLVYHKGFASDAETDYMVLHGEGALVDNATAWQDTAPTSTVYSIGTYTDINASSSTMVAYAWTGIQGFSKFGSYTGNGNANGPVVFTGFRPAYVMIKRTDTAASWYIYDNKRAGYNGSSGYLQAQATSAEDTNAGNFGFDILSNGFKLRGTYATVNNSGGTYIYIAFAEQPLVNSNGVPCTAR